MTLRSIERALRDAGIENYASEARCLCAHFTGFSEAHLLSMRDTELDAPELCEAVRRRVRREPLQYILGEWEFMGLPFSVSPACLIPRPETETLVETALTHLPENSRVADFCTGSGCIGISIAHFRRDVFVTAVELYENAALMAEKNAVRLGVADRFTVQRGDVTRMKFPHGTAFHMIVANPPYIALNEMESLAPELSYEPRTALTDGGDGLSVACGVLRIASETLSPDGVLLMEIGSSQGEAVSGLAGKAGFRHEILRDLCGRDRILFCRR